MTNFGATFKKARESRGISLGKIAAETRISTRFLAAIENEEFNLLPGGIFNRGFVRTYAEKVGLDPDQAVADYERLAEVHHPLETFAAASTAPAKADHRLYPIAVGALILVIVIFYIVNRESGHLAQTANVSPSPAVTQPVTPAAQPAPPPNNPPQITSAAPEPEPPAPVPAAPAAAVAPDKTQALTVEMQVKEETWIKIVTDGTTANAGEVLKPGMTRQFTAQASMTINIGNAAGISIKINGMTAKPLGKSGQVRELTITPATVKDFIG
jgi:cytoskeleton protein RodZ